jgi:glycosyltransferase involved in cell wall biosynthesis
MRWLIIATHVPPTGTGGGIVRYTVELSRALNQHSEVDLHVLTRPRSQPFFAALLGHTGRVSVSARPVPSALSHFVDRFALGTPRRQEWDVVQGCKHLLPSRASGRRVLTVHDMLILDRPADFTLQKRALLPRPYLASIREADSLLCVSGATRDRLLHYAPEVAAKTQVIHLASSATLRTVRAEVVPQLVGRQFGLVVGDASPRKNLPLIVESWHEVQSRSPGAVLAVVGSTRWPAREPRPHAIEGSRESIVALGYLRESELRWCYENAAVVLCPSIQEGFGLPAVEAVEFGARVVTSTDPALLEVTGDRAIHLPTQDGRLWVEAIVGALKAGARDQPLRSPRTWDDVAAETVMAVHNAG